MIKKLCIAAAAGLLFYLAVDWIATELAQGMLRRLGYRGLRHGD